MGKVGNILKKRKGKKFLTMKELSGVTNKELERSRKWTEKEVKEEISENKVIRRMDRNKIGHLVTRYGPPVKSEIIIQRSGKINDGANEYREVSIKEARGDESQTIATTVIPTRIIISEKLRGIVEFTEEE